MHQSNWLLSQVGSAAPEVTLKMWSYCRWHYNFRLAASLCFTNMRASQTLCYQAYNPPPPSHTWICTCIRSMISGECVWLWLSLSRRMLRSRLPTRETNWRRPVTTAAPCLNCWRRFQIRGMLEFYFVCAFGVWCMRIESWFEFFYCDVGEFRKFSFVVTVTLSTFPSLCFPWFAGALCTTIPSSHDSSAL